MFCFVGRPQLEIHSEDLSRPPPTLGGKGVLNEGHGTQPWAALNYITFLNDVWARIAENTISILRSMKIHACIDLLMSALDHTYRVDISCSITSISSSFTPYIQNYVDPLHQLIKFTQKNRAVTFV